MTNEHKLPEEAYEWHRKPYGKSNEHCPVCGYTPTRKGSHRAVRATENIVGRYVFRKLDGTVDKVMQPGANKLSPRGRKIRRAPGGPTKRVLVLLTRAAGLAALGKTHDECAAELGVKTEHVRDWQQQHKGLWTLAYDRAMENVLLVVQSQAGTDAILDNPDQFVSMATACDRWARSRGKVLFPVGESPTLTTFFDTFYRPNCLSDARASTLALYRITLNRWRILTGDPPIAEITSQTMATYRDCLAKLRGRRSTVRQSPNTVRSSLKRIQTLLSKAGPPGQRNRDAQELIDRVPWVRPPRAIDREPRIVTSELIAAAYTAAPCMEAPWIHGFKPAAWWRALLVVAYNTGLRRCALLGLRMADILWDDCVFNVKAEGAKTRTGQRVPFNQTVRDHLLAIRTDRDLLFPWPGHIRSFHTQFHRLQRFAAIPNADHFGLHDLRRTAATLMWEESPAAAQLMLGHTSAQTTKKFYVNRRSILARAVERLPQPAVFGQTIGGAA
jgi:integrase